MALDSVLKELAKLSPEEQKSLRNLFGAPAAEEKKKNPPEAPRAQTVYFFEQHERFGVTKETVSKDGLIKKEVESLPSRVIAVDEKMASKLYWKSKKFVYLGRSNGKVWSSSRGEGKTVGQAQALEFEEMKKTPDMTPPPNREKTFFRGAKVAQIERGQEIPWREGLNQNKVS